MRNAAQEAAPSAKPFPKECNQCPVDPALAGHWSWSKANNRWVCRQYIKVQQKKYRDKRRADPVRYAAHQDYMKKHGTEKSLHYRVGAYKSEDKRKGFAETLSVEQATPIMNLPCTYCKVEMSGGLDRVDNTQGHTVDNVVPCCVKCNGILIDLPYQAKLLLAEGLKAARLAGYLDTWLPPQLRKNGVRA